VALNAITFSVGRGETFGIIGENGAGKSTLLKVLARTLKPTSGEVQIHGRTAALLELGTGFNPELSGEENIYLNAYLMGLSKGRLIRKSRRS
jgi:ABC-type polysaccharide/polyol phosphate transport system ATPase subunit